MNYSLHIKSAAFALEKTSIRGRFFVSIGGIVHTSFKDLLIYGIFFPAYILVRWKERVSALAETSLLSF